MKPPRFDYFDPETVEEVLSLLHEYGDDAKVLAGGQSLVPLLNLRLARPAVIVSLRRLTSLDELSEANGVLRIGALTRQATLERSSVVARRSPLLREAVRYIGHPQIRNRGTVGGSAVHADPAAELPTALVVLDAVFQVESRDGSRRIQARDFFRGYLTTSLAPDELLVAIELPTQPKAAGIAFEEFARRPGDFALGGAAATISLDRTGACSGAAIGLLAAGPVPLRAVDAESILIGQRINPDSARAAAAAAVADIKPIADVHGDSGYRRAVVAAMCRRAILNAGAVATEAAA